MTFESIESRYKEVLSKLQKNPNFNDLDLNSSINDLSHRNGDDNGGVFYGFKNGIYFEAATERGEETYRRETNDSNEFLSWLVKSMASGLASEWASRNRIKGQDFRRQYFAKNIEILKSINETWAVEEENHLEEMLSRAPFDDS